MTWLIGVSIFIFGLIIGSFLNVVIYRHGTHYGLTGRSECLACAATLRWFELVPLLSFLIQGGHCRRCSTKLSWQYPLVEAATGLLFLASYFTDGSVFSFPLFLTWIVFSLLIVITVYDFRHKIIPNLFVYSLIVVSLINLFFETNPVAPLLTGLGLASFFALLWLISHGRWIGLGDAKLAIALGFYLGPTGGLSAVIFAFWAGALIGLALIGLRRYNMKSELPFAPFLVFGFLIVYFFHLNVFELFTSFSI